MASNIKPFTYDLRVLREISVLHGEPLFEVSVHLMERSKAIPKQHIVSCLTLTKLDELKTLLRTVA